MNMISHAERLRFSKAGKFRSWKVVACEVCGEEAMCGIGARSIVCWKCCDLSDESGDINERCERGRIDKSGNMRVVGDNKGRVADSMPGKSIPLRSGHAQPSRVSGMQRVGVVAAAGAKPGSANR